MSQKLKKTTKKELTAIAQDLLDVCRELLPVVSRKASTGACMHDRLLYGQTWEELNKQLCQAINQAVYETDSPVAAE